MDCDISAFDFLREAFPEVDIRVIKATVLEHGDDVDSALSFLNSVANEGKDASPVEDTRESCFLHQSSSILSEMAHCDDYVAPELSNSNASSINQVSLEGIVEEAKNDKELVINLVKEVSNLRAKADQENIAALKAKSEAATIGESLLKKVDEVRKQTSQRKQDNLLRMGEIYGEKAVLATEARELKVRLEQVKMQKERAIATLNEIQGRLQGCYDAAVEERKMAEEDGRIKEEKAQKLLVEEEALMAIVEQESQKLEVEAEACTQLKEFLAHHGSIVDSLQGEMSILCEDVESFKRQVEEGMWSSVSTASLQSNVNPEGPYTFRRCNMPSATSSQDLGQSFDSSRRSYSGISASPSQEVPYLSEHSNVSSQELDKGVRSPLNSEEDIEWRRQLAKNGSLLCGNREDATSNIMDFASSDIGGIPASLFMLKNGHSLYGMASMNGIEESMNGIEESVHKFTNPLDSTCFTTEGMDSELDNTNYTTERLDSECAGGDWVFTTKQLEDSRSSTSSMVKIEADDYRSE